MQVLKGVPSAFLEVIFTTQCRHALAKSMCLITDYDEWLSLFFLSLIYLGSERDSDLQLVVLCVPTPPFTSTPHTEVSFFFPLVLNLTVENEHVGIHVKFNVWFEFQSLLDLGLGKFMSAWISWKTNLVYKLSPVEWEYGPVLKRCIFTISRIETLVFLFECADVLSLKAGSFPI